jgi:hypothetical protein
MTKLVEFLQHDQIVLAIAERVNMKHPDAHGICAVMAKELTNELKRYGISAIHVVGQFRIDQPNAESYMEPDEFSGDDCLVDHDWVRVEGKVLDVSARQFRKDVSDNIPDIVFINHTDPLFLRYDELGRA